jgi:hypothetical protein
MKSDIAGAGKVRRLEAQRHIGKRTSPITSSTVRDPFTEQPLWTKHQHKDQHNECKDIFVAGAKDSHIAVCFA